MYIRLPTLEDVQINESNDKDTAKLSSAASEKDAFLPEHGEKIHETFVGENDIDFKRDSKCFREQHSVFVSKDSICHDKVSSFLCELEPCNNCHGNSQPTLRCLETPQMSEGCPSSSSTKSFFNGSWENSQNTKACPISFITSNLVNPSLGYHAKRILHSSRQKAIRMVDVAMKVVSSMKVGEDAYAMIGRALDSAEIQQFGSPSKILRTQHCFNPQNGSPENCHHDFACNPAEIAATVHLINSTVPSLTQNDSQVPPKLISACVAALLMIQASSESKLPPAETMEILEHAERDLRPHYTQNLHIYREIEDLMGIIKTQILTLVRTPTSNLHL
ncbi:Protein ALWAYS EARLY 1 [Platanthera guangdongensis]|uniref:Protein ALWAYS EARLY 1 n=1 Tax=Platanthera guangdongensis TaxID=2320717 RepID=A0ABR2M216_9ASPA